MSINKTILSAVLLCACFSAYGFCRTSFNVREDRAFDADLARDEDVSFQADSAVCDTSANVLVGEFTAYNPCADQTDDTPLVMASGKKVYKGAIACPSTYEFGTKIEIESLGIYTCEDRMAARFRGGEYFDILMFNQDEAIKFGRRTLQYEVM